MEYTDYTKIVPDPPSDLVEWMRKNKLIKEPHYVIFKGDYLYNPLTQTNERVAKCHCTACNGEFFEGWVSAEAGCSHGGTAYGIDDGREIIYTGDHWLCPECAAEVKLSHAGNCGSGFAEIGWAQILTKVRNEIFSISYMVRRTVEKSGIVIFEVKKYEAYVFGKKKAVMLKGYRKNLGNNTYFQNWQQLTRCSGLYGETVNIYPYDKEIFKGTYMENSRVEKYLEYDNRKSIEAYLRFYQKHPQIENLFTIGFGKMVANEFDRCYITNYQSSVPFTLLNWKEKSPYKVLGIDRNEALLAKKYNWDYSWLIAFKNFKAAGVKLSEENTKLIMLFSEHTASEILKNDDDVIKTLKYLQKQSDDKKRPASYVLLRDYWSMAKKLGYNLKNPIIKSPKNLKEAHHKAVERVEFLEEKELTEKFRQLGEKLGALDFEKDGLCMTVPKRERELIVEGKILEHCVGGYGKTHCSGNCVFFVRRADSPDAPYFTLNIEISTGIQLQLHGYQNERGGQKIPKEVTDFIDYWLKNVFRPFDIEKMRFKDEIKPKKQKKAAAQGATGKVETKEQKKQKEAAA